MGEMWKRYNAQPVPAPEDWAKLRPSDHYDQAQMRLSNGMYLQVLQNSNVL